MTVSYPTARTTSVSNPRLRVLNKLNAGQYPLLTFMAIPSVRHAQIVALTGLDVGTQDCAHRLSIDIMQGVIIDCEHGHIGDSDMHNAVSAISALGVSPIIRIRGTGSDIIKRALDTGAQSVPRVPCCCMLTQALR